MVICLARGADMHMAQLMPLSLSVSCFSKIQIGFTFLVLAHLGSPEKGPLNGCVCVCVCGSKETENLHKLSNMFRHFIVVCHARPSYRHRHVCYSIIRDCLNRSRFTVPPDTKMTHFSDQCLKFCDDMQSVATVPQ